jgi:hypothetical protein
MQSVVVPDETAVVAQGLDKIPIRWPAQYDPVFFERLFREVLAKADVRNAIGGLGISITGESSEPATISSSEDLQALFDADLVMAEPDTDLLPNARALAVESGVVSLTDDGPGGDLTIGIESIPTAKLAPFAPLSVLSNAANSVGSAYPLQASANDTVLRREGDVLEFGQLTADMAPDDLWPYAKLDTGVQASLDLADSAVQPADLDAVATSGDYADLVGIPILPTYTVATVPSAATFARGMIYVSDETGGAVPAFSDGADWRRVTDRAVVA